MCVEAVIGRGPAAVSFVCYGLPKPFLCGSVCEAEPRREAATGQKGGGRATERYASSCDYNIPGVQNQQPNVAKVGSGGRPRMSAVPVLRCMYNTLRILIISMFIISMRTLRRTTNM